jgi:hypothetical protein
MNIVERIQKLYRLSERNNSTEEAASAAAKIQELCFKHNLELEAILAQSGDEKEPCVKFDYLFPNTNNFDVAWKRVLLHAICETNFCLDVYYPKTVRMAIIGQKQNYEVAVYEFDYLAKEIQRLAVDYCITQGFLNNKERKNYIKGFCEGAMSSVCAKLRAAHQYQAQQTNESRALVVVKSGEVDKVFKEHFPHTKKSSFRSTGSNSGRSDGRAAGNGISVNRGVNGTQRTQLN